MNADLSGFTGFDDPPLTAEEIAENEQRNLRWQVQFASERAEELQAEVDRLRDVLRVIIDYAENPTAPSVNAGDMTAQERLAGIAGQAWNAFGLIEND